MVFNVILRASSDIRIYSPASWTLIAKTSIGSFGNNCGK
ncbi:hypothetical protein T03_14415 [Trichinella britovi]|uniref:Uncharacterized protein n=1 Tax=Trichinella britovi TaxID=45882 RepID=A0A0V0YV86_TRIBR|nr:hypothetical protein T03_14415 [Trichinella britovi]